MNGSAARTWMVSLTAGLALLAGACSSSSGGTDAPAPKLSQAQPKGRVPGPPTPVDGMYTSGTSILTIKEGGWTRTLPDMGGAFAISGDQLVLSGQAGCPGQGTYTWTLSGEVMTLVKVNEACAQRDIQFVSVEKWRVVHQRGEQLKDGQTLLLADGHHVATYHGELDVTGQTEASIEAFLSVKEGVVFSPTVLTGSPGQEITLTIINPRRHDTEKTQHNFKIDELGVSAEVAYGESAIVTLTLPETGSLRFYCAYHSRLNQQGEILVAG